MTLTNNLESYWAVNNTAGRGIQYSLEKQREYSLSLDLNFVNTEQLNRFYNGTTTGTMTPVSDSDYTKFTIAVDYKTIISGGNNYKALKIVFSDVVFDEESLPTDPKDILKQTISAKAGHCMAFYITNETQ